MARRKGKCRSMKKWIAVKYGRGVVPYVQKLPRGVRKVLNKQFKSECGN